MNAARNPRQKPRLLVVINRFGPYGTERGLVTLAKGGFFEQFDVHIVGLARGYGPVIADLKKIVGEERVSYLDDGTNINSENLGGLRNGLAAKFDSLNPHIVMLSLYEATHLGRDIAKEERFSHLKVVTFEHGTRTPERSDLLRSTDDRTDIVLGNCPQTLAECKQFYSPETPSLVVPTIILPPDQPPPHFERAAHVKLVSFGRFAEQKNYLQLLEAVELLLKDGRDIELDIAGGSSRSEQFSEVMHKIDDINNFFDCDRIIWKGFIREQNDLDDLMKRSHIYVEASQRGNFSSVFRAWAMGMPVVSPNVGPVIDYGRDGENMTKIMLDADGQITAERIAEALGKTIDNYPHVSRRYFREARSTIRHTFSERAVKAQWQLAIDELKRGPWLPFAPTAAVRPVPLI